MIRKHALSVLFVFSALPLFAQRINHGAMHSTGKRAVPQDSETITFPPIDVGKTEEQCFYNCFYLIGSDPNSCNYSGMIDLVKMVSPPFRLATLHKATIAATSCSDGTPVTLPVSLQAGEILLQDFTFSPTAPGSYRDTQDYLLTPTASAAQSFSWILTGSTPSPPPQITSFAAVPSSIQPGQQVTLSWTTTGALSVSLDNGLGSQPQSGTVTVTPSVTTTYTLTATNSNGSSTASVTVNVITTPALATPSLPKAMLQLAGSGGSTTTFTATNSGGGPTNVTVSKNGNFFSVSPTSFTLGPGATQVLSITMTAQASGEYDGSVTLIGTGVAVPVQVPIKLLVTAPPEGPVTAKPGTNRVDVSQSTTGSVTFTNNGPCPCTLTGIVSSDVPWLIPQNGVVTIPFGSSVTVTFTIDRTKRADTDIGSTTGSLSLVYFTTPLGKTSALDATPVPSVSLVSVVDTVPLTVNSGGPPPLLPGEVALFVPGVGHIAGSVGTFISDLSMLNPPGNPPVNDVRLFYSGTGGATGNQKNAAVPSIATTSVALADVVKNVFASDAQVGSLQIRSANAAKLVVNTNIFNSSNPAGTYGTSIPTFRSDRAVGAGDRLVLSGIRQDSGAHTNLFFQETAGVGVTVATEFLDVNGSTLGTRSDTVAPFALMQINSPAPTGTVAAILTNTSSGAATFLAYATPVDNVSGDNWSVADWSRQYGYAQNGPVVIPVAGVLNGANNTFFRTDVTITNTGTSSGSGTLTFYPRGGTSTSRTINLGGRQSTILNDVIGTFFGAANGTVGYLLFTPSSGAFAITNRTYTTAAGSTGTFGSAAPVLAPSAMLTAGSLRAIGSLQDAARATTTSQTPATFRTNFGMVETSGNPVTVRVTLRFNYPAGAKTQAIGTAFKDYNLGPNEFVQKNGAAAEILGSARDTLGDLRGMELDFQIIGGTGAVVVYASSVDNGTGDSILRLE